MVSQLERKVSPKSRAALAAENLPAQLGGLAQGSRLTRASNEPPTSQAELNSGYSSRVGS